MINHLFHVYVSLITCFFERIESIDLIENSVDWEREKREMYRSIYHVLTTCLNKPIYLSIIIITSRQQNHHRLTSTPTNSNNSIVIALILTEKETSPQFDYLQFFVNLTRWSSVFLLLVLTTTTKTTVCV